MARRRKMDPERKAFISSLLEHYQPKDAQDVQDMLKDLLGETLQGMLEAEMDDHLGYSKYDYKNKETDDSRNGYSPKTVTSSMGSIDLDIPRDRKGDFEPQIVKKNQTDISNIEDQVLSMYVKGMTTRDISAHLKDVYGVDASAEMISHMTDRILPIAKEWQNRPLERKYAIVFMDTVHFHVREDNRTVKKAVYVAIGVKLNGKREILGMWVGRKRKCKILVIRPQRDKKQRCRGYHDRICGWIDRIRGCDSCSIPAGRDPEVYSTSDPLFNKVYFIQRFKTIYGRFKTGLQSGYRGSCTHSIG